MKVVQVPIAQLSIHPAVKSQPRWAMDDTRLLGLADDIRARGVDQPITVDSSHRIVDGRHRYWAAKLSGVDDVPCKIVADHEVNEIVVSSLLHRRHYTKSQRAYLIAPIFDEAFSDGRKRHLEVLNKGGKVIGHAVSTAEMFADKLGIGDRLVRQARDLWNRFKKNPELREEFEPKILDEESPIGLGAAIAGIAGKLATEDKPKQRQDNEQLELFSDGIDLIAKRWRYWEKIDEAGRTKAVAKIRRAVAAMPPDLRDEWKKAIKVSEKAQAHSEEITGSAQD